MDRQNRFASGCESCRDIRGSDLILDDEALRARSGVFLLDKAQQESKRALHKYRMENPRERKPIVQTPGDFMQDSRAARAGDDAAWHIQWARGPQFLNGDAPRTTDVHPAKTAARAANVRASSRITRVDDAATYIIPEVAENSSARFASNASMRHKRIEKLTEYEDMNKRMHEYQMRH